MNEDGTVAEEEISRILNSKKLSLDLLGKFVGNISDMSYNNAAVNPDVALNLEYTRLRNDQMRVAINKAKGAGKGEGDDVIFKNSDYITVGGGKSQGGRSITGSEARTIYNQIKNQEDILGGAFTWKDDAWYNSDGKKIGNNNDLVSKQEGLFIQDDRFYDIESIDGNNNDTALGLEIKDFTVSEDKFKDIINEKYDLSNYIIRDARGMGDVFELMNNSIQIADPNTGEILFETRTNYGDLGNAKDAATAFNKWINDNNIKLKSIPGE